MNEYSLPCLWKVYYRYVEDKRLMTVGWVSRSQKSHLCNNFFLIIISPIHHGDRIILEKLLIKKKKKKDVSTYLMHVVFH